MIGVPMPNPRDSIIEDLNKKMEQFFGSGKTVQEIASGVSAEVSMFGTSHTNKLRAVRDRFAPQLKKLADEGMSLNKAAETVGLDHKRVRLIARENGFKFNREAPQQPGAPAPTNQQPPSEIRNSTNGTARLI